MANSISKFKKYIPMLDEVYKAASKTSVLDGASELAKEGASADELIIPKIAMDGLGDYDRSSGYKAGDVTFTNETVKCNFDRGRMFSIDTVDNMDTAGLAYAQLSAEFIRTKVVPELDAFRMATYAGVSGISTTTATALSTGATALAAVAKAYDDMTDDEVPEENRYLFITPTLNGLIRDLDTTKSKEIMNNFAAIIVMPQSRFYTAIDQLDGSSTNEKSGGYKKHEADSSVSGDVAGVDINFMIIHKSAIIQYEKHVAPKVVTPEANQDADAWKFGYRNVGIAEAYENKVAGIYLHKATS